MNKVLIALIIIFLLGCGIKISSDSENEDNARVQYEKFRVASYDVYKFTPIDNENIVCFMLADFKKGGISCIKKDEK